MLGQLQVSDKIEHFGAYAMLGFLPAIHERMQVVLLAALCLAAMGIGLEFGQLYSPGRSFEIADMIVDGLGICLGLAVGIPLRTSSVVRYLLSTPGK
jgi:VanZ family protein